MTINFENKGRILMENCFIQEGGLSVDSWYGYTHFELSKDGQNIYFTREEFDTMFKLMQKMKEMIK